MTKTLQQIKDEVFEHPMFTEHEDIDWVIDQVAIRYAQEQNRELVVNIQLLIQSLEYDALGVMSGLIIEELKELLTKYNHLNQKP